MTESMGMSIQDEKRFEILYNHSFGLQAPGMGMDFFVICFTSVPFTTKDLKSIQQRTSTKTLTLDSYLGRNYLSLDRPEYDNIVPIFNALLEKNVSFTLANKCMTHIDSKIHRRFSWLRYESILIDQLETVMNLHVKFWNVAHIQKSTFGLYPLYYYESNFRSKRGKELAKTLNSQFNPDQSEDPDPERRFWETPLFAGYSLQDFFPIDAHERE